MKTVPEMLFTVARENGSRVAVSDQGAKLTYADLVGRIVSLAGRLRRTGVKRGDRVALLLPNGLDFVVGYFSIAALGAIVVPLNDRYQKTELVSLLDECDVSLMLTSHQFAGLSREALSACASPCKLLLVEDHHDTSDVAQVSWEDFDPGISHDAPVMHQFSSGSTGSPKRIARTHDNLLFELDSLVRTLNLRREDRFLGVAPFSHVNGLMRSMMACMRAGATLYPLVKFERRAVAELVEKDRVTVFIGVPFMFSMLAQTRFRQQPDFSSLRLAVSASAPMPTNLNRLFHDRFGMYVRQLYGSTETGTISVNLSSDIEKSLDSVGKPILGVEVEVLAEDGHTAKAAELGELAVNSPGVITRYEGLPEVNREVFRGGYFLTGDLGKRDEDGLLYLVGRKKFFINKGGYKINPHEIEELLERHRRVDEAVVVGVPTTYGDERLKAVIVSNAGLTEEEVIEHCKGKIADFKIPSLIEFRESLPKSATGKVRRGMLVNSG